MLGHHCNQLRHLDELVLANGMRRAELYNYPVEERDELSKALRRHDIDFGVHAPLFRKPWYPFPPTWMFLHDTDDEKRQVSLRLARETIAESADLGAEYVVVHFPGPTQRAKDDGERSTAIGIKSCQQLDAWAAAAGIRVCLEGFGPHPLFEARALADLLAKSPHLAYTWDTGHMHYAAVRDGFDYGDFARTLAPYVATYQLWTSRLESEYLQWGHVPVHPALRPEAGWADIAGALELLLPITGAKPIIMESAPRYPADVGDYDYRQGIWWVRTLLDSISF